MPSETFAFMFGGTKKRSTLVEDKIIQFPREDSDAPRQKILQQYCPNKLARFHKCLEENSFDENKCPKQKKILTKCSNKFIRQVNQDPNFIF